MTKNMSFCTSTLLHPHDFDIAKQPMAYLIKEKGSLIAAYTSQLNDERNSLKAAEKNAVLDEPLYT